MTWTIEAAQTVDLLTSSFRGLCPYATQDNEVLFAPPYSIKPVGDWLSVHAMMQPNAIHLTQSTHRVIHSKRCVHRPYGRSNGWTGILA
jgi:hypothetical protein